VKCAFSCWKRRFLFPPCAHPSHSKRRRADLKHADWEEVAAHLQRMLQSVKFGSITLVVQDGKVIQIEKNEKVRLQSNKAR
jgi:hypothetical protein